MEECKKRSGSLEDYLLKNERNNISKVTTNKEKGKLASLDYEVLKYVEELNLSVVKINLHTGRHHQIRVQFSSRGHSLCGDTKYGTRSRTGELALWSYKLEFNHPTTKERLSFKYIPEATGVWSILKNVDNIG